VFRYGHTARAQGFTRRGGAWFLFANPFNTGVRESEHFTAGKFDAIRKAVPVSITNTSGFPGIFREDECDRYVFTGSPAAWVIGHKEAWRVVDHDGRVVHRLWNVEP
jgi:hypothetical protein